jgi:molybdate transport system substrate-binding protein
MHPGCRPTVLAAALAAAPAAALAAALVLATACDSGGRPAGGEILVAAAADLAAALPELAAAFEHETGVRVTATLGSSGQLAQQVLQGAPVDVVLAADAYWIDRLEEAGRLEEGTTALYAYGVLVLLAGRQAVPPPSVAALAGPEFQRIALANPEHAPYGRAAAQALERAGVADAVASRLILAENVRQTVQFAETRTVDAALSARSLMDPARHHWVDVPAELHEPLAQTAAVVRGSPRRLEAAAFVVFLLGSEGRAILDRHRFVLP